MKISDYVEKEKDYIVSLRRYFHSHPEESLKEFNTAKKIEEELEKLNIEHRRVGETGVIGIIKGKIPSKRVIAIRADIDGLKITDLKKEDYKSKEEGYMHACGHDGHTASLLGTAKILKEKENILAGEVRLFFQQAEEIGKGAKIFIKEGYLEGVESILGIHVASDIDVGKAAILSGPRFAACDYFKIKIKGRSAHVSNPHLSVDALYIACQIVVNLQSIVSRQTNPIDTVVVGIGTMKAGTIYNAVAGEAVFEGTSRTFSTKSREHTNKSIRDIAENIGKMYNAEIEVEFEDNASALVNDEKVTAELVEIAKEVIGIEEIITNNYPKKLSADDFADYVLKIPGAYIEVGSGNFKNYNTCVPHHNELFDIDEEALLIATNLEVNYALSKLTHN